MRFMMIIKANADTEAGVMPSSEAFAAMGRYNEELIQAGALLAAEGLQASSKGARVSKEGGRTVVQDGPFSETKELIAGFWLIDVKNYDEALAWAKRVPLDEGDQVELRKVFEAADFPADLIPEENLRKEQEWRAANERPVTA